MKISDISQSYAGLFGYTYGASIHNLTVDGRVNAANKAAIIVGEANDTVITDCNSSGQVWDSGVLGGIAGEAYDSMISDCKNTGSILGGTDISGSLEAYAGGICGSAHSTFIGDCVNDTNDSYSSIYSEGSVGGLVGRMQSGRVKNGRFAGTIGASTSSALKTAGLFIGYIESGNVDTENLKLNPYARYIAGGNRSTYVTATTVDGVQLGYNGGLEWHHFDEAGYMQTGWFTDQDGNRYFLHNVSDGTQGHMVTGWYMIEGKWFYFNPVPDGTRGSLYVNRNTPDGYTVGADGIWQP